jgi:hypothetical protein
MRTRWLLPVFVLCACKGESDQSTRALPAPEPPATAKTELTPATAAPERKERPTREIKADIERPKPAEADTEKSEPAAPQQPSPEPAPSAAPAVDANCQQTCQTGLQTCLAQQPPDPDGGTSLEGLAACKKSLDDCKARCSP